MLPRVTCRITAGHRALVFGLGCLAVLTAPLCGAPVGEARAADPQPTRHFRIERPADLTGADALTIYDRILDNLVDGYGLAGLPYVREYRTWTRFNTVPYRSAQHGQRYVNNYGNAAAQAYGDPGVAAEFREGAILVKDSFAVTARGDVFSGPLFVMEKMAPGFNPVSRDWRYTMIMPDGSLFGVTKGQDSAQVGFCVTCHETVGDKQDHLFFVPEDLRVQFLDR